MHEVFIAKALKNEATLPSIWREKNTLYVRDSASQRQEIRHEKDQLS